jgi:hypothetical protein
LLLCLLNCIRSVNVNSSYRYQKELSKFEEAELDALDEITRSNTNNISEGRNSADRRIFVGKNGGRCTLFEQVVLIKDVLDLEHHRYKCHMERRNLRNPDTIVSDATKRKASKLRYFLAKRIS